jgi:hypothetical protein
VSRRKLSPKDFEALSRGTPVSVRYPPGGGPAELRVPGTRRRWRRNKPDE